MGSQIAITFKNGVTRTFTVGAVTKFSLDVSSYLVSTRAALSADPQLLPNSIAITVAPGQLDAVKSRLDAVTAPYSTIDVQPGNEFALLIKSFFNFIISAVNALLAFAIAIAVFGIVNTLILSVTERTPEIGLLRSVGMSRRQLRTTIRAESVILAADGTVVGMAFGLFVAWAVTQPLFTGSQTFSWPVEELVVIALIGLVIGAGGVAGARPGGPRASTSSTPSPRSNPGPTVRGRRGGAGPGPRRRGTPGGWPPTPAGPASGTQVGLADLTVGVGERTVAAGQVHPGQLPDLVVGVGVLAQVLQRGRRPRPPRPARGAAASSHASPAPTTPPKARSQRDGHTSFQSARRWTSSSPRALTTTTATERCRRLWARMSRRVTDPTTAPSSSSWSTSSVAGDERLMPAPPRRPEPRPSWRPRSTSGRRRATWAGRFIPSTPTSRSSRP